MVDLDSPLVPLAALWLAGNSSRGRDFSAGLSGRSLLAGSFGSASAGWAGGQIQNLVGSSTVTPELATLAAGGIVSWAGRRSDALPSNLTNPMAAGILYNVGGQSMNQAGISAGQILGDVTGGGTSAMQNEPTTQVSEPDPEPEPEPTPAPRTNGHSAGTVATASGVTF